MNLDDIKPGPAIWICEHRGGYGYTSRVLCDVVKVTGRRVKIRALLKNGGFDSLYVKPESIQPQHGQDAMRRAIWDEKYGATLANATDEAPRA